MGKNLFGLYVELIIYRGGSDLGTSVMLLTGCVFADVEQTSPCIGTARQAGEAGLAFHIIQGRATRASDELAQSCCRR